MSFYTEPAFFVIVAALAVPAVVLGLLGKQLKYWGLVASAAMLVLLFCRDIPGAVAFLIFLADSTAMAFYVLWLFKNDVAHKVGLYRVALALALVPLVATKVSGVFDANVLGFIGISYLTFKSVQVLIETRDGIIEDFGFFEYLYFLVFFPVFTSGPIMRSRDFMAQLQQALGRTEYLTLISKGALWLVKGILYAFVGAPFFQWLQWFAPQAIGAGNAGLAVLGALVQGLCYGLWLFFDFAGYSFMAMGIGSFFGIRVPTNFRAPFRSVDIKEFWDRWHITLSYWLRDFVFMRLTRAFMMHRVFKSRLTTASVSFIINMFVMGCWHGLTVDYIVYGLFHGVLLALCEVYQKKSKFYKKHRKQKGYKLVSWAVTMIAVFFSFALFSGQVSTAILGAM